MSSSSVLDRSRPVAPGRHADSPPGGWARLIGHPSLFLFVVLTSQLMVVLDGTIVNVALPHIQRGLGFSSTTLSWVLNAYSLTFGGLLLLGARAGDLLGRRRTFLIGIAVFSLGSLSGGFATHAWMLLASRGLQGVGGAFAAPSALALLTTVFPEGAARVRAIGLFTAVSVAGGATGLVAGGVLTEWFSWRWVMFVNVPIGLTVWVLGRLTLVETPRRPGRFDLGGAISSTLGMGSIVFGLVEAGSRGWGNAITIGSLVAGAALLAGFVGNERHAAQPILPLRLLAHRTRSGANAARGLLYAGANGLFFFLTQFMQNVQGYSPLRAGLGFLPIPATVFLTSQLTSRVLVRRYGAKRLMVVGISLAIASFVLFSRLHTGVPYVQVLLDLVLFGAGFGISLVSLTSASLADVKPEDAGAASGLINVMQQIGPALGVAVLVTVFGAATHHASVGAGVAPLARAQAAANFVHGADYAFATAAVFLATALLIVVTAIGSRPEAHPAPAVTLEVGE